MLRLNKSKYRLQSLARSLITSSQVSGLWDIDLCRHSQIKDWKERYTKTNLLNALIQSKELNEDHIIKVHDALSSIEGGLNLAMVMREDLTSIQKDEKVRENKPLLKEIRKLDEGLRRWLNSVLCEDSLSIERITFDSSSGYILENVARGEAVHKIRSLSELKSRLHDGKRCFGLFHSSMPSKPLSFIHVALTKDISHSLVCIEEVQQDNPHPKCAIFYSVNSPYDGLGGLDLASRVIKRASSMIQDEYPSIQTLCTLSPIPNFMTWLNNIAGAKDDVTIGLPSVHLYTLQKVARAQGVSTIKTERDALIWLNKILKVKLSEDIPHAWISDMTLTAALKGPIEWLGCHYIAREKYKSLPLDPVARFHLRNGATFYRLNYLANPNTHGLISSAGLMVNYLYESNSLKHEDHKVTFKESFKFPLGIEVTNILNQL